MGNMYAQFEKGRFMWTGNSKGAFYRYDGIFCALFTMGHEDNDYGSLFRDLFINKDYWYPMALISNTGVLLFNSRRQKNDILS